MTEHDSDSHCSAMPQDDHDILIALARDLEHAGDNLASMKLTLTLVVTKMDHLEEQVQGMQRKASAQKGFVAGVLAAGGIAGAGVAGVVNHFFGGP